MEILTSSMEKRLASTISDYLRHEALDRTSVIIDTVSTHLVEHEFISNNPKYKSKVEAALLLLIEVYQGIGEEHLV